jgi:dienelactone hydrolase
LKTGGQESRSFCFSKKHKRTDEDFPVYPRNRIPFSAPAGRSGSSGRSPEAIIGQVFSRHGYVFLFLYRQGVGLSADQGAMGGDLMARAFAKDGQAGRNRVQLQLLENEELDEAVAGLSFLRTLPGVDVHRIGMAGHSFGGSLSLILAERDAALRAVVLFGAAAASWEPSPGLRERLLVDRYLLP